MSRPTDEQLEEWLYAAEYDWDADYDPDKPMPVTEYGPLRFPDYYQDDYHSTLAAVFGELLESRRTLDRVRKLTLERFTGADGRVLCQALAVRRG